MEARKACEEEKEGGDEEERVESAREVVRCEAAVGVFEEKSENVSDESEAGGWRAEGGRGEDGEAAGEEPRRSPCVK